MSFFSFWPLLAGFIAALLGARFASNINSQAARIVLAVSLLLSLYLLAGGINMAIGWHDPIGATDTTPYIHGSRDWFVIQLLRIWPYVLIVIGLAGGVNSAFALKQKTMPSQ